jgi:transcriptional regulator with XRE-family HTH domain
MKQANDLKSLRVSKGKTTRECGVSQPWYIALEKGRRLPEANAVSKIAAAFDVPCEVVYAACQESRRRAAEGERKGGSADVASCASSSEGGAA